VAAAAETVLGRPVVIADDDIAAALDPRIAIEARRCVGGASDASMSAMVAEFNAQWSAAAEWVDAAASRAQRAREGLITVVRQTLEEV
jgi:hypothetical protein